MSSDSLFFSPFVALDSRNHGRHLCKNVVTLSQAQYFITAGITCLTKKK